MEHVELAELDGYSTASASALELAGYQRASTASGVKRKRQSDTDLEDLQPLEKKVLCLIALILCHHRAGMNAVSFRNTYKK